MKKLISALFVLALGVGLSGRAYAGTEATTLDVSMNRVAACAVTTTGVNFGDADGTTFIYADGGVMVMCTPGVPYNVALDGGLNYSAVDLDNRHVSDGAGNYVRYILAQDVGLVVHWGDSDFDNTYLMGTSFSDLGTGNFQGHTVYGWLSGTSYSPVGSFTDIVNVTVYY